MAASTQRQRAELSRLNIPPPVPASLTLQQPGMQPLYSPALPTSLQQSFHPSMPMQTPMQPFFNPAQMIPPGAPVRPGHRGQQSVNMNMNMNMASVAQLAAAGIHPPNGFPITPMGGHFPRQSLSGFPGPISAPPLHPFPNRNRRQLSIGGPPKAVLGGPQRKLSPNPPTSTNVTSAAVSGSSTPAGPPINSTPVPVTAKAKKVLVNLPKETISSEEEGVPATRTVFAREPLKPEEISQDMRVIYPEATTCEEYPSEQFRHLFPSTVDVFLPGKLAWESVKHADIEQKLERLGVERGGNSSANSFIHGRAASVSSPADPALLFYKLNKLQQAQQTSTGNSISTSPQPPLLNPPLSATGFSPSPTNSAQIPRFITNRHGHSLSLAQPPSAGLGLSLSPGFFRPPSAGTTSNPFGPNAILGNDQNGARDSVSPALPEIDTGVDASIYAPQGRKPVMMATLVTNTNNSGLAPPLSAVRTDSRPDFARGFGLDIPEEVDEEGLEEEEIKMPSWAQRRDEVEGGANEDQDDESEEEREGEEGKGKKCRSQHHSRHVSRLSAALSLRSFGGLISDGLNERLGASDNDSFGPSPSLVVGNLGPARGPIPLHIRMNSDRELEEGVEEWTGSEDVDGYGQVDDEGSDDESIGEWSNPSDEERARQARVEARLRRRSIATLPSEQPRKLPQFPRPPDNTIIVPRLMQPKDDDIISNPSEEEHGGYISLDMRYPPSGGTGSRPLPLVPTHHSRGPSSQSGIHSVHDPARAHSRVPSNNEYQPPKPNLNPNAKPFVFGARNDSDSGFSFSGVPSASVMTHSRLPSSNSGGFGTRLNASAAEFKPGGFSFRAPFPTPNVTVAESPAFPIPTPSFPVPTPSFPIPQHQTESRPLPLPPANAATARGGAGFVLNVEEEGSPFKVQGREKRQRREASLSGSDMEVVEGDSMTSFRFPSTFGSPASLRIKVPSSPSRHGHGRGASSLTSGSKLSGTLNPTAEPFTFAGFSNAVGTLPPIGRQEEKLSEEDDEVVNTDDEDEDKENNANIEDVFSASATKTKRAPIPLEFKHPVSSNTVPAGLFKALANNSSTNSSDERTRPTVRSRLGSREYRAREFGREVERERDHDFYELGRSLRPSLDDLGVDMPAISHKVSRTRLVTDPGRFLPSAVSPTEDVFATASARKLQAHARRRSSLPDNIENMRYDTRSPGSSLESMSETSSLAGPVAKDLTTRLEIRRLEDLLSTLLDEKLSGLVRSLQTSISNTSIQQGLTPKAEEMISDVVSLFRTQLADSAVRGLDESHIDARGEMDFELIKDVVEQGHTKILELVAGELNSFQTQAQLRGVASVDSSSQPDLSQAFEHYSSRTINAVVEIVSELSTRLETIARGAPSREHDQLVDAVVSALNPAFNAIRPEAVDYEFLTDKLTQAVKPHISQIIDLASDKRETADLIVDRLLPVLLPVLQQYSPSIDTTAIALQLTAEVRKAIAPIDAFEIKEQVADLVVERLDSRLAVRDKVFNVESITGKVTENVSRLLDPFEAWGVDLANIAEGQKSLAGHQSDLSSSHQHIVELVRALPERVHATLEAEKAITSSETETQKPDQNILDVKNILGDIATVQQSLAGHSTEVLQLSKDLLSRISSLPDSIFAATTVLQNSHSDFILSRDQTKRELEDLRKSNTELQVQVHKARGAHGQVRVEKDMLSEKLNILEADRERLKAHAKELQAAVDANSSEVSNIEEKSSNLEEALTKALGRLQASDVATQVNKDRIATLEKANADLMSEKQSLKAKADSLELKVTFAVRDKENAEYSYSSLQKQYDYLVSQQTHWDDLRRTSEQIEQLTNLIGQADNEELNELRRARDRSKVLEGEHAALQKRFKEQENRSAANEKAVSTIKQSLSQSQARASEWEKRAKESEAKLERTTTQLEQAEQTHSQLDADYLVVKMQLEDREADERLSKDREARLREEISALETKTRQLQVELEKAKTAFRNPTYLKSANVPNGYPVRPDSRASTVLVDRSVTPNDRTPTTRSITPRSITPPNNSTSVWDSVHAPKTATPQNGRYEPKTPTSTVHAPSGKYPSSLSRGPQPRMQYPRSSMASPTPSTVSLAPTVDSDGWWHKS
ncbi:hypothetical protein BDP27DRAFT_1327171 [Rhodocollybia butyracea]|uniref:Uncharacterized protein n=1 Tax=Rhodocollybia butyracea TaxID=206335 RepID=A0A9P5U6Z7_9AGAR|nr:hypothetical protein BDP27DRAFT_1327171 [Rhodocollybia butyracea]